MHRNDILWCFKFGKSKGRKMKAHPGVPLLTNTVALATSSLPSDFSETREEVNAAPNTRAWDAGACSSNNTKANNNLPLSTHPDVRQLMGAIFRDEFHLSQPGYGRKTPLELTLIVLKRKGKCPLLGRVELGNTSSISNLHRDEESGTGVEIINNEYNCHDLLRTLSTLKFKNKSNG